jgi:hypothetical protein
VSGRPIIGSSRHGVEAQLNCPTPHYLLGTLFDGSPGYNSFQWWQESGAKQPPPTAALREQFSCEFSTYLSRVVGSTAVHADPRPLADLGFVVQGWEADVNSTPFVQPIGLNVRRLSDASQPVLREVNHAGRNIVALVNELGSGGLDPDASVPRPSLWLDFDFPQRAVGLDYGLQPSADTRAVRAAGVTLMAYNEQGAFIVGSDGDGCAVNAMGVKLELGCFPADANRNVSLSSLSNRIGVRDASGRIASVELRFGHTRVDQSDNPDRRIDEPQVVSRIWREGLPPAAVLQGLVGIDGDRSGSQSLPPFAQRYLVNPGPRTFALPYRFDRAVAFLRGFRLEASGAPAQSLGRIAFGMQQNAFEFIAGQGDPLILTPLGSVRHKPPGEAIPFDIVSYYTVVAWDSRQVEIGWAPGESQVSWPQRLTRPEFYGADSHTQVTRIYPPLTGERLFAGLQSVQIELSDEDEIENLILWPGYQRGLGWPVIDAPMLQNIAGSAMWRMQTRVDTDDDRLHLANARIVMLGGKSTSLALGADPAASFVDDPETFGATANWVPDPVFATAPVGPRLPPRSTTHDAASIRDPLRLAWPLRATVPFLTMGYIYAGPRERLGEIDVEHRGEFYNGRMVDWSMSYGMSDDPRSSSIDSTRRGIRGFPTFGAINPAPPRLGGTPSTTGLDLRDATIRCENRYPQLHGHVENTDRAPLRITRVRPDGDAAAMFDYEFVWRGERFGSDGFEARTPLVLRTGEKLQVHASYTPSGPAGVQGTALLPHIGNLIFESDSPLTPTFVFGISGRTDGIRPAARWSVSRVQLGDIAPGATRRQTVQLESTGDARLCVTRTYFNSPPTGFQVFTTSNAMDPDVLTIELGCVHGGQPNDCQGRTTLIVESNAGTLTLPVTANVQEPLIVVPPCVTAEDYFRGCRED